MTESPKTERLHNTAMGLDSLPVLSALTIMLDGQIEAAKAVRAATPQIALASAQFARTIRQGGRLVYVGSGSSGIMSMSDALELGGTFGIAGDQIVILLSEGVDALTSFSSSAAAATEDDGEDGKSATRKLALTSSDLMIALSASGTTPYACCALEEAKNQGAGTIGIASNSNSHLLQLADIPIHLPTPPELISGSTRLGAATAQKIALNLISTQAGIHLGHVHDGHMVNVRPDNIKLINRVERMVVSITGCDHDFAQDCVKKASGSAKIAILLASGATDLCQANNLLTKSGQKLRPALVQIRMDSLLDGTESNQTGA